MGHATASNFMNVAERFGEKLPNVGNLGASVLYLLAAPSTPDEIVAHVVERVEVYEIAENLHRLDLTKEQRDQHIRRYAELLAERGATKNQVQQSATPEIGYKKPPPQQKGIARQIAEETGLSADTVRRALNP